jgi:serine protease Do
MLNRVRRVGLAHVLIALAIAATPAALAAQLDPTARDRGLAASVELSIGVWVSDDRTTTPILDRAPVGSGVVVSATGLILTSWHVVDPAGNRDMLDAWEAAAADQGAAVTYELAEPEYLVYAAEGNAAATLKFRATVVAQSRLYDFAVLRISADAHGVPIKPGELDLPFVEIGDSEAARPGDPLYVFGYPGVATETVQVTSGVVSGFTFQDGITGLAWITTDAKTFYGNSGGAAVDANGALIGVVTAIVRDCAPVGDDPATGAPGCTPTGNSLTLLRPVHLALPLLADAGFVSS